MVDSYFWMNSRGCQDRQIYGSSMEAKLINLCTHEIHPRVTFSSVEGYAYMCIGLYLHSLLAHFTSFQRLEHQTLLIKYMTSSGHTYPIFEKGVAPYKYGAQDS